MFKSRLGMVMMVCAAIFIGITNYSHAQYSGPGSSSSSSKTSSKDRLKQALGIEDSSNDVVTVRELKKDPVYDEDVTVQGKLVRKTGSKVYRFEDGTGTMNVTIEDKLFRNKEISDSTTVEITGRLKEGKKKFYKDMDFTAKRLKVVKS